MAVAALVVAGVAAAVAAHTVYWSRQRLQAVRAERDAAVSALDALHAALDAEDACDVCMGFGFLVGQTYEKAPIPDGWVPVQRCDACAVFDGDDDAAAEYARLIGSPQPVVLYGSADAQGDWAVWAPGQ